jgi:zinc metalloprotease ZmpB
MLIGASRAASLSQSSRSHGMTLSDTAATARVRYDAEGRIRALYNINFSSNHSAPEAAARSCIDALLLPLTSSDSLPHLETDAIRPVPGGSHVRFRQTYRGIPVYHGEMVASLNTRGEVVMIVDNTQQGIHIDDVTPSVTPAAALDISRNHLRITGSPVGKEDEAALIIYMTPDGARLAYRVLMTYENPAGDWELFVEAHTGEVLSIHDRFVMHAAPSSGSGYVYLSDPVSRARSRYNSTGFVDNDDLDSDSLTFYRTYVPLDFLTVEDGIFSLNGAYATVTDIESPRGPLLYTSTTSQFDYTRSEGEFEAVNVYYHATQAYKRLLELGFSSGSLEQVRLDPHGFQGQDNSHYSPSGNWISFGDGGVDDAEDADVIWHEYGHAIQYNIVPSWGGGESGALGEGFADYWAGSYSRSLNEWSPSDPEYEWIFNWDGHNVFWSGRVLNDQRTYPFSNLPIHSAGQIWCSALMGIRNDLGRDVTDRLVVKSLYYLGANATAVDNAHAMLQADRDLHGGMHLQTLLYWLGTVKHFIDPEEYAPTIVHSPFPDSTGVPGPYTLFVTVSSRNGIDPANILTVWGRDGAFTDTSGVSVTNMPGVFAVRIPEVQNAESISYYFIATDSSGMEQRSPVTAPDAYYSFRILPPVITGSGESGPGIPGEFSLSPNYPNPFNPATRMNYTLPEMASVRLIVFDMLGREVTTLVEGTLPAGRYPATWTGTNRAGQQVSAGVYICRIEALGLSTGTIYINLHKMVLLK